ncbi:TonB-dependent outer membrane receptor [Zunongwangia atlantica 22II14-10F7]|uniref:TonB-dependent outer membrane receptor n=3 Tax=Zunongwangia TaxID=417127 RepID=A0A1Y1SYI9_9FLAO|nr:TonB-dependent outer membrane receptor [Zunongwangia atlantica 22II14-10F7]
MNAAPNLLMSSSELLKFAPFFQQQISGTVRDQDSVPIPGVNVIVQGSSTGTMTNLDGVYSIYARVGDTLVFSYIGFKEFKIEVSDSFSGDITLETSVDALDEVVINAGYYNTTQRERTGNIVKVSAAEIENQPLINPLQALQGRMAGVEIVPRNSLPGTAPSIRIRGTNSLRDEGNYPLYIIDGIPINSTPVVSRSLSAGVDPLNTIGLENIKSIEVLKDADATAIYGSRGANGVILVTTKKGIPSTGTLEARVYSGISTMPNRIDLLNTEQYLQLRKAAFENDGIEPNNSNAYDLLVWDQNRYTDWQDYFIGGTSTMTDMNLQYSGGDERTYFRLGGSYQNQGTIYPTDFNYQKITGNFNLNHTDVSDKLNLNLSITYGVDINDLIGNTILLNQPFSIPPNAPELFTEEGRLNWEDWIAVGQNNPLSGYFNESRAQTNNLNSNLVLNYKILEGLSLKANAGYTYLDREENVKIPTYSYRPSVNRVHESDHTNVKRLSWILEPQLIYDTKLLDGHLNAIVGVSFQKSSEILKEQSGIGYVNEALIGNLEAAQTINNDDYFNREYKYNAVFGRIGYNYKDKYFLNLTGRRDGSSRFGPGNRFANFGAIGAAWIFSEEGFLTDGTSILSFGKLRGSYGITGNDQIGDYGYLDTYEVTRGPSGLYPTQLNNSSYSWETNRKFELALELGFFDDKLSIAGSWYRNRSSNQLVGFALPSMTGFTSVQANLPATVENKGLELELNAQPIKNNHFVWEASINFSLPNNALVSYPQLKSSPYSNTYQIGKPLNIVWLYQYGGLDPETGIYTIVDVNDDGRFDFNDRTEIEELGREYFGGFNNSFSFKNLNIQFLWQFVKQRGTLFSMDVGRIGNQREAAIEALNPNSVYQIPTQGVQGLIGYAYAQSTSFFYTDASFLRLKTLSLNYSLPSNWIESLKVKKASLFIQGQNLFTITPYKGLDPEVPQAGTSFANLRSLTAGIQLNF